MVFFEIFVKNFEVEFLKNKQIETKFFRSIYFEVIF
jgi:hypothetical protein